MSTFKVGDRVRWTSQAGGYTRAKVGVVERIVPANGQAGLKGTQFSRRDHDSYIVRVKGRGLYWPLVSKLELDAPNEVDALRASLAARVAELERELNGVREATATELRAAYKRVAELEAELKQSRHAHEKCMADNDALKAHANDLRQCAEAVRALAAQAQEVKP